MQIRVRSLFRRGIIYHAPTGFFLVCLYFAALTVNYAYVTPPFEAADEAAHFLYVHNLLQDHALPRILSREGIATQTDPAQQWAIESHQPPLYYLIGAVLISWTDRSDLDRYLRPNDLIFIRGIIQDNHNQWLHTPDAPGDTGLAVSILRGYSITLGLLTLGFVYLTAREFFDRSAPALLAMLFVASIPTFVSISASVNNDNLVVMLYSAGISSSLRIYKNGIRRGDLLAVCVILVAIALTKITGLSLFAVVWGAILFSRRESAGAQYIASSDDYGSGGMIVHAPTVKSRFFWLGMTLVTTIVFAGWWYLRNWTLYGDPLALTATQTLWGRQYEIAATSGDIGQELMRIGKSFWLMVGHLHLPVFGTDWFYGYVAGITGLGIVGGVLYWVKKGSENPIALPHPLAPSPLRSEGELDSESGKSPLSRYWRGDLGVRYKNAPTPHSVMLLCLVCLLIILTLLIGTRSVDISYGRLLFPALAAFAPLMILGWRRIFGRATILLLLPLIFTAWTTPAKTIAPAYPMLTAVDALPQFARPINVDAEGLILLAYEILNNPVNPGREMRLNFYMQGNQPQNPALLLTAIDPITLEGWGHVEIYPGMAATDLLNPEQIYSFPAIIALDNIPDEPVRPRLLRLQIEWLSPEAEREIPLVDANGTPLDALLVDGAILDDERYTLTLESWRNADVTYSANGGNVQLRGYRIQNQQLAPGGSLTLETLWSGEASPAFGDWILTMQLLDSSGSLITQSDGEIAGYPTSAWIGLPFLETRTLTIPENTPPGEYRLMLGWYRLSDFARLPSRGENIENDLYVVRGPITVQ